MGDNVESDTGQASFTQSSDPFVGLGSMVGVSGAADRVLSGRPAVDDDRRTVRYPQEHFDIVAAVERTGAQKLAELLACPFGGTPGAVPFERVLGSALNLDRALIADDQTGDEVTLVGSTWVEQVGVLAAAGRLGVVGGVDLHGRFSSTTAQVSTMANQAKAGQNMRWSSGFGFRFGDRDSSTPR